MPIKKKNSENREYIEYRVKKGDWLSKIAKSLTTGMSTYHYLATFNNLQNPDLLEVGLIIKIPTDMLKGSRVDSSERIINKPQSNSSYKLQKFLPFPEYTPIYKRTELKRTELKKVQKLKPELIKAKRKTLTEAVKSLYHQIPDDYRAPINLLRDGNFEGLMSYIQTAYDRKISNDYVGTEMKPINMKEGKETQKYRLSEPSVLDFKLAAPQRRTGILGKSISYMNMPYDINVKDYKWHYRQRGDMSPVPHTYGMLAPIFLNMQPKNKAKYHSGIIFNPRTGQLSVEPDLNKVPEDWFVNDTGGHPFKVKGMKKDEKGNLVMIPAGGEYRNNFTTIYDMDNGFLFSPNVFTDPNNPNPRTLGATAGGHFIISAEPKKGNRQTRLVHGSLQNLSDAIDRLKSNTDVDYVMVYPLDGGSFSMGYIPLKAIGKNGMEWTTIEPSELNKYQNQNSQGSSGFMPIELLPQIPDTTYIISKRHGGSMIVGKHIVLGLGLILGASPLIFKYNEKE